MPVTNSPCNHLLVVSDRALVHLGDKDSAWPEAGKAPGIQIWRIEKFNVVSWPTERTGSFYDGDSYIVLHASQIQRGFVSVSPSY